MDDRAQTMGRGLSSKGVGLKPALGHVDKLFQDQDVLLSVAQLGGAKGQEGFAQLLSFAKKLVSEILVEEFQIQKDGPANRYPPAMIEALAARGLNTPQGRLLIRMESLASGRSPEQLALDRARDPNELVIERKVEQYQALASAGRFDVLSPQFKDDRSFALYQDLWPNLRPETQRAVGEMQAEWNSIATFWDKVLKGERPEGPIPNDRWGIKEIALQRLEEKGIAQLTALQSDLASGKATVERMQEHLKTLDHCTSLLEPGWEQKHLDQVFGKEAEALREVLQFRADFVEGKKEYWHRTIQEGKPAAELWDHEHYQPLREYRDAALANGTYGPLVEAIQKEAETVHLAYAGLHQAKEGWWQAHVKGEPTGVWEEKAKEARAKLAECDPGASALWGSSHAWNVDREYTEKIDQFERSYEQRWEALLSGDTAKLAQAEAGLQELPGFSSAETRALDQKYQPLLKESYLRVQGLLNGSPGLAPEDREASQALLDLWRDNVPQSLLEKWDYTRSTDTGLDLQKLGNVMAGNEGHYDTIGFPNDNAGLSFGKAQWTARYTLREQIIRPYWEEEWFKEALRVPDGNGGVTDLNEELRQAVETLDKDEFVQWSYNARQAGSAWREAWQRLGRTPQMQEIQDSLLYRKAQSAYEDVEKNRVSSGIIPTEVAVAWGMDARNQMGSIYWGEVSDLINKAEAQLGRKLIQQERILIAAKAMSMQASDKPERDWRSDVWGREAAFAVGKTHRSDYRVHDFSTGPQEYVGDPVTIDIDPECPRSKNGYRTNTPEPAIRATWEWNADTRTYDLVSAQFIDPSQANDPTQ